MAFVKTIPPEVAVGRLHEAYENIRRRKGNIPNVARVQSLRPEGMEAGFSLYTRLMDAPSGLSFREKALIATVVSKVNGCHY